MNETQRRRALADVKEFFLRAGALAALLLVLFGVVFGLAIQPDDTMYPHLKPGDLLLYYRLPRSFAAGEVVVFTQDDRRCTGRVAARGGDTVEVTENTLLRINGSLVAEPDIYETTPRYDSDVTYPLTLADGEYFILCDAREGAPDSRRYGPVTGHARPQRSSNPAIGQLRQTRPSSVRFAGSFPLRGGSLCIAPVLFWAGAFSVHTVVITP